MVCPTDPTLSRNTVVGAIAEDVQGVYKAPTTAEMFEVVDIPEFVPAAQIIERNLVRSSLGRSKDLVGILEGNMSFNVEARSGGLSGGVVVQPDIHNILKSTFGRHTPPISNPASDTGHTATTIELGVGGDFLGSVTISTGVNDKINFKEDGSTVELTATVAASTYTSPSALITAIKTALEVAGAGTYTITYDNTTRKYTVTVSGGAATFLLIPVTGTDSATQLDSEWGFTKDITTTAATQVSDADTVGTFQIWEKGDIFGMVIAGALEVRYVESITGTTLTTDRAFSAVPGDTDTIFRGYTYKVSTDGHDPMSLSVWFGDRWLAEGLGARCSSMEFSEWETGQIPKLSFAWDLLSFDDVDGTVTNLSPATSFNTTKPPLMINGDVFKDSSEFDIGALGLSLIHEITPFDTITALTGRCALFVTGRSVEGSFDPLVDVAEISIASDFKLGTDLAISEATAVLDTSDNFTRGTVVGVYMPQVNYNSRAFTDADGFMKHELGFRAFESDELNDEMFFGLM